MQCNIDARGKALRLIVGGATLVAGVVLGLGCLTGVLAQPWWWAIVIAAVVTGGFCVFEGWNGWCAVRAMGFKTPM